MCPGRPSTSVTSTPDVLRVLTQRKVVDYLRRRRAAALRNGDYEIEVIEGRRSVLVTPEEPDGVRLALQPRTTLWGRIEYVLHVAPAPDRRRRVAVVGRAGTTIIDDLCQLEELDRTPWSSDQVGGQIVFPALQQTSGRRAILRDRDAFPIFLDAVAAVEPVVTRTLERISAELDAAAAERLADLVRRVFGRVLRELEDIQNPMRTPLGAEPGDGGLLRPVPARATDDRDEPVPDLGRLAELQPERPSPDPVPEPRAAAGDGHRSRSLPSIAPDPEPGEARSRFDAEAGLVLYNPGHADYLLVKDDEPALVNYLASLVAKEYVVYNNPRAPAEQVAEELVRMLVRVRRHLPARRSF